MALFGLFVLMGQRTGVTGMVLSRAAFGRRGAYLPAAIQACLAVGWCAVNTWIILDLVMALLGKIGVVDPAATNYAVEDRRRRAHHGHPGRHLLGRLPDHRRVRAVDRAAHHRRAGRDVGRRLVPPRHRLGLRRPGRSRSSPAASAGS